MPVSRSAVFLKETEQPLGQANFKENLPCTVSSTSQFLKAPSLARSQAVQPKPQRGWDK